MSTIVTCSCGVKLQLPQRADGQLFRCPKCKLPLPKPAAAPVPASPPAPSGEPVGLCPICQSPIGAEEKMVTCALCHQVHHQDCWLEVGGCSTYGCEQAPAPEKEAPAARPLTAWGDTKTCPACGETIKSIALRCRYCGEDFDTVDPLKLKDLRKGVRKAEDLKKAQNSVVGLFIFSLIGCLAPLALIFCLAYILPRRALLARAGPFYLVLGYSALALSVLYSVMMVVFLIGSL